MDGRIRRKNYLQTAKIYFITLYKIRPFEKFVYVIPDADRGRIRNIIYISKLLITIHNANKKNHSQVIDNLVKTST